MRNAPLGCLTFTGIMAALITAIAIAVIAFTQGGVLYSPGALNAQAGEERGGVASHAATGGNCKACHTAPWDSERMADRCAACHTEIAAQMRNVASLHGSINHNNPNLKCIHCHPDHRGPDAPLTISVGVDFPHEALGFSLAGHQLAVTREPFACADCHAQGISTFNLQECTTCHQQMDAAFMPTHTAQYGAECLACHDGVDRFGKSFSHNAFSFHLDGRHAQVDCASCHANAHTLADFASAPQTCFECHQTDDTHAGSFGTDCGACHSVNDWTSATFDHNLSAFKLEGKHAGTGCEDCHNNKVYQGTPTDCHSCHAQDDKHDGKFGADCAACHTPSDWKTVTFDHARSAFPLTGAHERVDCAKCHVNDKFAGTPTACVRCHADPAVHLGQFGTDCAACHTTTAWSPASFNGQHTFPLNHGEGGTVSCATCHPSSYTTYTCYGCHEHDPAKIEKKHIKEGIRNFENCVECHPTGNKHEGGDHGGGDDD